MMTFEDIMKFDAPLNEEVYSEILDAYKRNTMIPFVGAGISATVGFPTWYEFLQKVYARRMAGGIVPDDLLIAASKILEYIGYADFHVEMRKFFGGMYSTKEWQSTVDKGQNTVLPWLTRLFRGLVVTTNFDCVLENLYMTLNVCYPSNIGRLQDALIGYLPTPTLFKLHGCVSNLNDIILTEEQYNNAYIEDATVAKVLEQIFLTKLILFLGCSLKDDYTIKLWEKVVSTSCTQINHFAIVGCKDGEQQERRRNLSNSRIRSIIYDESDHDAVRIILERLHQDAQIISERSYGENSHKSYSELL